MDFPTDRYYLESHEWHKIDGDEVVVGISRFAVDELTDITYLEYLKTDGQIDAGEVFGEIESVKATSELYCGIAGQITAVNDQVADNPAILNEDPHEAGWLIRVKPDDMDQVKQLLDASAYSEKLK